MRLSGRVSAQYARVESAAVKDRCIGCTTVEAAAACICKPRGTTGSAAGGGAVATGGGAGAAGGSMRRRFGLTVVAGVT